MVQLMVLDENDGITETNALGERPFFENDPARPNDKFFDRVVEVADEAAADGLYVALLPAWGDQLTAPWGNGPRIFRNDNRPAVHSYAKYLAKRLKGKSNVVWMLGGDRPAKLDENPTRSMAERLRHRRRFREGLRLDARLGRVRGGHCRRRRSAAGDIVSSPGGNLSHFRLFSARSLAFDQRHAERPWRRP